MKKLSFLLTLLLVTQFSLANSTEKVPSKMTFADIKLIIKPDAKKIIAENIQRLKRNESYFQSVVRRADIYLPLVEEKLKAVGVPQEIKFLCIQESELIAKAVSSSNAVGYWQFKKATAQEVGLTVDSKIDERKNIASASIGAAKYIKKNNSKLDNWLYAVLSYYSGLTGVQKYVKKKYLGANTMEINRETHWYVLKFLSHILAFQNEVGLIGRTTNLIEIKKSQGTTVANVAKKYQVEKSDMLLYNAWIDYDKKIPENIPVIVPVPNKKFEDLIADKETKKKPKLIDIIFGSEEIDLENLPSIFTVNGVKAILAKENDSFDKISDRYDVSKKDLLSYNELVGGQKPEYGEHYFIQKKKKKAIVNFHTVEKGETIASIAQQYGIKKSSVIKFNRITSTSKLEEKRILWMRSKRPKSSPIEFEKADEKINPVPIPDKSIPTNIPFPAYTNREKPVITEKKEAFSEEIPFLDTTSSIIPEIIEDVTINEIKVEGDSTELAIDSVEPIKIEEVISAPITKVDTLAKGKFTPESNSLEIPDDEIEEIEILEKKDLEIKKKDTLNPIAKTKYKTHIITKGETFYSISKKYNVSIEEIKELNKHLPQNSLSLGQELKIPASKNTPVEEKTHTVDKGETFYSISKKYGISLEDLKSLNNKKDYTLSIGERLKIKK